MKPQGTEAEHAAAQMTQAVKADSHRVQDIKNDVEDYQAVCSEARFATELEQTMTFKEGIRLYPRAIAWSMLLSTAIIMEGFDIVLLSNFYTFPEFLKKFGVPKPGTGELYIPAPWQSGLSNGALVGEIFGLMLNGLCSERFGYRKTMIVSLAAMTCFIFFPFFAPSLPVLLVGQILQGIPWGVFQTLTTAYASEVCPVALRAYLTTYVNLCWVMGQFLASGVLRGFYQRQDFWAYRIPYAMQWIWPVPILIGCIFAPESPWWLVRNGRIEEAKRTVRRLTSPRDTSFDADKTVSMMVHTNSLEKSISSGTSFFDCFKGVDRRRTEIACGVWAIQNLCGSAFMGYSTFFLVQAGLPEVQAFNLSLAQYAIGFLGTVSSWFLMRRFGRRTLYIAGLAIMFVLLLVIGFIGILPSTNTGASWAVGAMLLTYTFFYDITVGPVCYCLVAEISSTRLRSKTIVLARNVYNLVGLVNGVILPYMLGSEAWNWQAKAGFFWAGICSLCLIWTYFRLPEPKGRTYGELDILFEQKVSARMFRKTAVDQFQDSDADSAKDKPEKLFVEYATSL